MDESELIQSLLEGKESAFRQAVMDYQPTMLQVARALVGPAIADEVVQEAWVSIIKALPGFEGRASLKTWILRIVSNGAKTRLRKETRSRASGDLADLEQISQMEDRFKNNGHWLAGPGRWSVDSPDNLLSADETRERLVQALEALPEIQRSVFVLREQHGMEMDDICKILDISASNSRVLLHRARMKLWQTIEKAEQTDA